MNAIAAIITVIVAIILFTSIAYVKAPPNRAAIITGLLKEPRILRGKAGFKIPFFERVDWLEVGQMDISVETEEFIPNQTMTIEDLIKAGKMESSVEFPLKRYVVVNIGFFNNEDAEEETQLTLGHDPLTKEGIKELKELFTSLANEFDTKPNRVTYIHIVATAQTDKELEAMGY